MTGPLRRLVTLLALLAAGGAGCNDQRVQNGPAPTIDLTASPDSIGAGQPSMLAWTSTDASDCAASGGWTGSVATSGAQSVTPAATTVYTLSCTGAGGSASRSVTVTVLPAPTVTITAAPGTIAAGQSSTLTWSSTGAASCTASGGWSGARATAGTQSVSPAGTTTYALTCAGTGGSDSAAATVTVVGAPTVTLSANPDTIAVGQTSTLTWSTTDATSCTASGGWSGAQATSGSQNVTPTSPTTYTLGCTGIGGSASASVTVTISSTPAAPVVTIAASPTAIAAGQPSTLTWTSTNATACTAGGGWTGGKATSGSQSVSPTSTTTYTLSCTGAGGTGSDSATVTIVPAPTVTLTASADTVASGGASTLTWSSTNATSCAASGGWTGGKATSGTQSVSPTATTTYTLTCSGVGGSAGQSVTITVPPGPTVSLSANPAAIASGQASTLTWSSSNATGCTASGGWTGSKATSGTQSVSPTATTTYTLTCTGSGGSTGTSATVTVVPPPTVTLAASPTTITSGQSSTLTWSSSNATSCTASGGWTGTKSTSGTQSVSPTSTTTYTLSCTGTGGTGSQSATVTVGTSPPPGTYAYPLKVGPTGRYLVDQNGAPFLLVGDAAWSLVAQLSDTAADSYLANRQQLHFDAVLVNLIEHQFSDSAPRDIYGLPPFTGKVFTTPNPAYFTHADYIIQSAAQKGILVLLAPAYTGYGCGDQGWAVEMQNASDSDMTAWGQFLGQHYASYDNIMWVIGGDADPTSCSPSVKSKLQDVVNGIQQYDTRHPFTAHNVRDMMGITPWTGASWLNVNTAYTDGNEYKYAQTAYAVTPTLPFFLIEAYYENEGAAASDLRAQVYWTTLSGGFGQVFGNCPIWFFGSPTGDTGCGSLNWRAALGSQGSLNMEHFQRLFTGRHWWSLVPDLAHTVLTSSSGAGPVTAACAADSSSIIAYLPSNGTVTISGSCLKDSTMTAWWVDPGSGAATSSGTVSSRTPHAFTAPSGGSGDWVLVVDSPSFGFSQPGG